MKILENVKTIDSLGRIVIPQDMRDEMQIRKKRRSIYNYER